MGRKKRRNRAIPQVQLANDQRVKPQTPPATASLFQTGITGVQYSGPIPPPEMLRGFDEVLPGAANRILAMAERQETHRHSLETAHVRGNMISQYIGQASGLAIALAGIGCGTFLLYSGRSVAGFGAMFGPLAGLAVVFLFGRRRQEHERKDKLRRVDHPAEDEDR